LAQKLITKSFNTILSRLFKEPLDFTNAVWSNRAYTYKQTLLWSAPILFQKSTKILPKISFRKGLSPQIQANSFDTEVAEFVIALFPVGHEGSFGHGSSLKSPNMPP
jgi:hypothetical protein